MEASIFRSKMVTQIEKNSNPSITNINHHFEWSCTKVVISRLTRAHPPLAGHKFQTPTLLTIRCLYILRNDNHLRWVPITSGALNSQSERFRSARCENLAAAAAASISRRVLLHCVRGGGGEIRAMLHILSAESRGR